MGGRKSYKLDAVVGKTKNNQKNRQLLLDSVKFKDHEEIASSTLDLVLSSKKVIENLSKAVKALDFISENAEAPSLDYESRRRLASEYWAEHKKKTESPSDPILDRIIINSITKVIRRGRRK